MTRLPFAASVAGLALSLSSTATALTIQLDGPTWGKAIGFHVGLAGRDLNGISLNGEIIDGQQLVGARYDGASLDGEPLESLELDEGNLTAVTRKGKHLGPQKLAGVELIADVDGGGELALQIVASERHPDPRHKKLWGYEVWYEGTDGWQPLCGVDADGVAVMAVALQGRWEQHAGPGGGAHVDDPARFTLACEGFVLAKCVTAGYEPWARTLTCSPGHGCEHGDLADHHQACTRALRADYFGDGTAHTTDGVLISMYDGYGVREDSEDWTIEAEWDADGAVCVSQPRNPAYDSLVTPLYAADCGDPSFFGGGTLLVTEVP